MAAAKLHEGFPHAGSISQMEADYNVCLRGHSLSDNLCIIGSRRKLRCRACVSAWQKAYHAKFPARYSHLSMKSWLKKQYGISPAEHADMLAAQRGVCAICKGIDEHQGLGVDHNHTTGKVRGLLCTNCNQSLGKVRESKEILQAMISYLEKWEG
jgi:hypothetical protein